MEKYLYDLATDKEGGLFAGLLKIVLLVLSWLYGAVIRILIFVYRINPRRLNCKVISIGNITVGGTGKTPMVELAAKYLKSQAHRVAILSRGYKRKLATYDLPAKSYELIGDEPYMLKEKLGDMPLLVDTDRIRSAAVAMRDYGVDTVVLDDGFQQWKIKKDLEIVTINAVNPFGNRHMLPRGILREPLVSLKRADIFILAKTDLAGDTQPLKEYLRRINSKALILETAYRPLGFCHITDPRGELIKPQDLKGESAAILCGIADPGSFKALIENLGLKVDLFFKFADHHCYTKEELVGIIQASNKRNIRTIITTEKDMVRLPPMDYESVPINFLALAIAIDIKDNEEGFYNRLLELYRR